MTPLPPDLLLLLGGSLQRCRYCGCTDDHACPGGCSWISEDVCSRCPPPANHQQAEQRSAA